MKKALSVFILLFVILLTGCSDQTETGTSVNENQVQKVNNTEPADPVSRDLFAMDTFMTLTVYGDRAEDALDAAEAEIRRLDDLLEKVLFRMIPPIFMNALWK